MPDVLTTQARLDLVGKKVKEPSFRRDVGLGNEAGYYIFDYPAKDELIVREWVQYIKGRNNPLLDGFELAVFDLYDIMIDILEQEGVLEQCYEFEKRRGIERVTTSVGRLLKLSDDSPGGLVVDHIREHTPDNAVVFLIGVGKCYPVLRSHKVLNNLHQVFDTVPVILFYPGKYEEKVLVLFNDIKEDNYYWATRMIKTKV